MKYMQRGFPANELFTLLYKIHKSLPERLMHIESKMLKNSKLQMFLEIPFFFFFFLVFTNSFCREYVISIEIQVPTVVIHNKV